MSEVLFYHLERRKLEQILPYLLKQCLEKNWRSLVQMGSPERVRAMSAYLWEHPPNGFFPHGSKGKGFDEKQPIFLSEETKGNPNKAEVLFLTDGALRSTLKGFSRIVFLFDGSDEKSLTEIEQKKKELNKEGHSITYWKENAKGGFDKEK
ncbi:MAG: DNA polymerase III subunit chi [Parvibaculales bacterium]